MSEPSRRRPRQQRSAATVDALLGATRALLQEHDDTTALTVRTVAERAGLSPAAVYRYFENVDQLIDAVLAEHTALAEHAMTTTIAICDRSSVLGLFRSVVQSHLALYTARPDLTVEFRSAALALRHRDLESATDRRSAALLGATLVELGILDQVDAATTERIAAYWNSVGSMMGAVLRSSGATREALESDLDAMVEHVAERLTHVDRG